MRVNIYAEEMPADIEAAVQIIGKDIEGQTFTGCRLYLHLPVTVPMTPVSCRECGGRGWRGIDGGAGGAETCDECGGTGIINVTQMQGPFMHHPGDDDSAAVTFWGKRDLRPVLKLMLERLDAYYDERAKQGKLAYLPD